MTTLAMAVGGERRIIGGPFGSKLTQADYSEAGIPVIRGSNMGYGGRWISGPFAYVSPEKVRRDLEGNLAFPGDIIVTQRGTLGQVSIIPLSSQYEKYVISQSQMAISVSEGCADSLFLYYWLTSSRFNQYISQSTIQTGVPHINLGILRAAPFSCPPPAEQRRISSILGTLDDKIELNRQMNETLEAVAGAFFRDWFVDFGPTLAKGEGRTPYLVSDLWSLFPSRLDEEGKPEGWELGTVGDYMVNFDSKRIPVSGAERARKQGPYPYHGATGVMDYVDGYLFDGTYLLVGEDGSVAKENGLAFTQYVWGKLWVNNHAHVLQGRGPVSTEQLLLYFQHEPVSPYITGAVQLKLSQGRMNAMPFLFAGRTVCERFAAEVAPLFAQLRCNVDEIQTLTTTRDLLLSKLISGELCIRDAEKAVGAIV